MNHSRRAVDLLEEAAGVLLSAPASAMVVYLAGAVPFLVALLFFLNEMMRSPFAAEHLVTGSLGLAVLFVWKNFFQALFTARLFRTLSPGTAPKGNLLRLICIEATLQPVSLLIPLPFPWTVAFFRNVSLFAALGERDPLHVAGRQSVLWTRQNWGILAILSLAALVIFVNALLAIVFLPQLARSFLGIEGDLVRAGGHILNSGTLGAAAALTWLAIDPVLDAVYVLRCFYGQSLRSGEDLRAALRRAATIAVLLLAMFPAARAQADSIDPARLDHSIDEVVHRREFSWRTPQTAAAQREGRWVGWVRAAGDLVRRGWEYVKGVIDEWFRETPEKENPGKGTPVTRKMLETLIGLVVALIVGAAVAFYLRGRKPAVAAKPVAAATPSVNLADESTSADQLPESGWLTLADECVAKGDLRLAMRALYLAGLNVLGARGLISIRKWKSGVDYRRELERRARSTPEICAIFHANNAQFEQIWYGFHAVDREIVSQFASDLSRMKAGLP